MSIHEPSADPQRPNPLLYVACYGVWTFACVLMLWSMLVIRNDILVLTSILGLHPFTTGAIDRVMLIGMGILATLLAGTYVVGYLLLRLSS